MSGFSAFLLAAGRGRRAGGPKAWLKWEGKSLLERQVDFLAGRYGGARVAVTIQPEWLERCRDIRGDVRWVGEDPDRSPFHALRSLARAGGFSDWVSLHHVDMPVWRDGIFKALEERVPAAEREGKRALVPVYEGKGGHPVFLSSGALKALAALDPETGRLDRWLRAEGALRLDVGFEEVVQNWNEGSVLRR